MSTLRKEMGDLVTRDMEKAKALVALVFTSKSSGRCPSRRRHGKDWENEELLAVGEDQV